MADAEKSPRDTESMFLLLDVGRISSDEYDSQYWQDPESKRPAGFQGNDYDS